MSFVGADHSYQIVRLYDCCNCGWPIAMTQAQEKRLRRSHEYVICPTGHRQCFSGQFDKELVDFDEHMQSKFAEFAQDVDHIIGGAIPGAPATLGLYDTRNGLDNTPKETMETQHRHIKGYRDLRQGEIAQMNAIKDRGEMLHAMIESLQSTPDYDQRWVAIAKTHLQQGIMAAVRAVAKPDSF